jgi:hypothetical protein
VGFVGLLYGVEGINPDGQMSASLYGNLRRPAREASKYHNGTV